MRGLSNDWGEYMDDLSEQNVNVHDYIAPGEFTYDSSGFMLEDCAFLTITKPDNIGKQQISESIDKFVARQKRWKSIVHTTIRDFRFEIVKERIRLGFQPKWWTM